MSEWRISRPLTAFVDHGTEYDYAEGAQRTGVWLTLTDGDNFLNLGSDIEKLRDFLVEHTKPGGELDSRGVEQMKERP